MAKFAQKKSQKNFVAFACDFLLIATRQKFTQNKPLTTTSTTTTTSQTLKYPTPLFEPPKTPHHETGYKFLISKFIEPTEKKVLDLKQFLSLEIV
jgi:hypothetical protein